MRIFNTVLFFAMLIVFGYIWIIKSDDLASLPYLGLAILSGINDLTYRIEEIKNK